MAGNVGKLTFWTTINTKDPNEVAKHPIKAKVQTFRDNWLVYRNEHITLASAKVAPPKPKGVAPSATDMKGCLSALSERFNPKDPSKSSAAQKNAVEKFALFVNQHTQVNLDGVIRNNVSALSANQLQQLRKNSAALLEGTEIQGFLAGKSVETKNKIIDFLRAVHDGCDDRLAYKKGYSHHELSPTALIREEPVLQVDVPPPPGVPPPWDDPPPLPAPLAMDKPAVDVAPNDEPPPTVKAKPTPAISIKGQVVRSRLESSVKKKPQQQKGSGELQSPQPSSPSQVRVNRVEPNSPKTQLTEEQLDDFDKFLDALDDKDAKAALLLKTSNARPLGPNDPRLENLSKPKSALDGVATPSQDLEEVELLSAVPSPLPEPATPDEPVLTETKTTAAPIWSDAQQAEANRRTAAVEAAGLVDAINTGKDSELRFFKHLNTLTNPVLEPYVGDALKQAVGTNSLNGFSFPHFNSVMTALDGRREAWENIGIDKQDRIEAMLTKWDSMFVEEKEKAAQRTALSEVRYQGIINMLKRPDMLKPTAG